MDEQFTVTLPHTPNHFCASCHGQGICQVCFPTLEPVTQDVFDALSDMREANTTEILQWLAKNGRRVPKHRSSINQRLLTLVARGLVTRGETQYSVGRAVEFRIVESDQN